MLDFFYGPVCGEQEPLEGKLFSLFAGVSGEMAVEDVPLAPGVDVSKIIEGDENPLEVVVEVPVGKSKRGWNYTPKALEDIVNHVNTATLAGFKGHQDPEKISNEFLDPVTHWVGAKMGEASAFFRGVIDPAAKDLKRFIRSGRIKQVSIYGRPKLKKVAGETQVVGYDPLSIDWTPLDRPGMPTRIAAISGEMWDLDGKGPEKERVNGEMNEWQKAIQRLLDKHGADAKLTLAMICGEMNITPEQAVNEMGLGDALKVYNAAKEQLGITGEMDVTTTFKEAKTALDTVANAGRDKVISEVVTEKVTSEAIRGEMADGNSVIGRLWSFHKEKLPQDATKEVIAGEMDKFLSDPVVKNLIDEKHTHKHFRAGGGSSQTPNNSSGASVVPTKRSTRPI